MSTFLVVTIASVMLTAAAPAQPNPVLTELLTKGVVASDGATFKLPPPILPDGLDSAGQRKALDSLVGPKRTADDLLRRSSQSPIVLNIRSPETKDGGLVHRIDLSFVAFGDWKALATRDFQEGLLRSSQKDSDATSKTLAQADLAKRNIKLQSGGTEEEHYSFNSISLLDRVQVSSTRYSVSTRGTESLLVASKVDPRFNGDGEFPNEWRPLVETDTGELKRGDPQPYTASAFYVKVTRLAEPAGAIFIEYHMVFEEPQGWFKGSQQLRSKLRIFIQDEVQKLRRRLAKAQ